MTPSTPPFPISLHPPRKYSKKFMHDSHASTTEIPCISEDYKDSANTQE